MALSDALALVPLLLIPLGWFLIHRGKTWLALLLPIPVTFICLQLALQLSQTAYHCEGPNCGQAYVITRIGAGSLVVGAGVLAFLLIGVIAFVYWLRRIP